MVAAAERRISYDAAKASMVKTAMAAGATKQEATAEAVQLLAHWDVADIRTGEFIVPADFELEDNQQAEDKRKD
jgi:hypothetical protein